MAPRRAALGLLVITTACEQVAPSEPSPRPGDRVQQAPKTVKPLVGVYELTGAKQPDGKKIEMAQIIGKVVWGRWYYKFSGAEVATGIQRLAKDKDGYFTCEVEVGTSIQWTKTGYTIPTGARAVGRVARFQKLSAKENVGSSQNCSVSIEPMTWEIVNTEPLTVRAPDKTLVYFRRVTEDVDNVDWKTKVK